jgi:hypothetical protein
VPPKLSDWLNEYRRYSVDDVSRREADDADDWQEPDLFAPADRVRDTTPRWLQRAERVGHAPPTHI